MSQEMQMKDFFISGGSMKVFAANHTDGPVRTKMLGITDKCYHDKDEADLWLAETTNEIKQARGLCGAAEVQDALDKVFAIHKRLTHLTDTNNQQSDEVEGD